MSDANVDTTLNVYTQELDGSLRAAAEKVRSELFTIVQFPPEASPSDQREGVNPSEGSRTEQADAAACERASQGVRRDEVPRRNRRANVVSELERTERGSKGSPRVSSLGGPRGRSPPDQYEDGAPCRTRTCDLLVRSQTLYPTELRAREHTIIHFRAAPFAASRPQIRPAKQRQRGRRSSATG